MNFVCQMKENRASHDLIRSEVDRIMRIEGMQSSQEVVDDVVKRMSKNPAMQLHQAALAAIFV